MRKDAPKPSRRVLAPLPPYGLAEEAIFGADAGRNTLPLVDEGQIGGMIGIPPIVASPTPLKPLGTPEQVRAYDTPRGLNALLPSSAPPERFAGNPLYSGAVGAAGAAGAPLPPPSDPLNPRPSRPTLPTRSYDFRQNPAAPTLASAPTRNLRGEGREALKALGVGSLLGLLFGGGQGALAGGAAAGQGAMQGQEMAAQENLRRFEADRQNTLNRFNMERQGVADYNDTIERQMQQDQRGDANTLRQYDLDLDAWKDTENVRLRDEERQRREEADAVRERVADAQIEATKARAQAILQGQAGRGRNDQVLSALLQQFNQTALNYRDRYRTNPEAKAALGAELDRINAAINARMAMLEQGQGQPFGANGQGAGGVLPAPGAPSPLVVPGPVQPITPGRATITETPAPAPAPRLGAGLGTSGKPVPIRDPRLAGLNITPNGSYVAGQGTAPTPNRGLYASNPPGNKTQVQMDTAARQAKAAQDKATKEAAKEAEKKASAQGKVTDKAMDAAWKEYGDIDAKIAQAQERADNNVKDPASRTAWQERVNSLKDRKEVLRDALGLSRRQTRVITSPGDLKRSDQYGEWKGSAPAPSRPMNPRTNLPIPPQDKKTGQFLKETPKPQGKQTPRSMAGKPQKAKPQRTEGTLPGGGKWRILPD